MSTILISGWFFGLFVCLACLVFFKGWNFFLLFSMTAIKVPQLKINTDLVPEEVNCCLDNFKRLKLLMRGFLETRQVSKLKSYSGVVLKCSAPLICT